MNASTAEAASMSDQASRVSSDWVTLPGDGLGVLGPLLELQMQSPADLSGCLVLTGFSASDVLGPEVVRSVFKSARGAPKGFSAVMYPLLPVHHVGPLGLDYLAGRAVGRSGIVSIVSPGEGMEAWPYLVLPRSEGDVARGCIGCALRIPHVRSDESLSALETLCARSGIPVVRIVAGQLHAATKSQRLVVEGILHDVVALLTAQDLDPCIAPSDCKTVRAKQGGFLHVRADLGALVEPGVPVAATWGYETDLVEEINAPQGVLLEIRRYGRVSPGDVTAKLLVT